MGTEGDVWKENSRRILIRVDGRPPAMAEGLGFAADWGWGGAGCGVPPPGAVAGGSGRLGWNWKNVNKMLALKSSKLHPPGPGNCSLLASAKPVRPISCFGGMC